MGLINLCVTVMPFILITYGVLGVMGLVQAGPRELPRLHPTNRKLSATLIALGLGIFLIPYADPILSTGGIVLCMAALVIYSIILRQARHQFPEMSSTEWLKHVRERYKFMKPSNPPAPKDRDKK